MTSPPRIKICGLTRPEHARAASRAGAHAIGLVFAKGSPRHITPEAAVEIARAAAPGVEIVGLFVDHPVDRIQQIADTVGLTLIQLHGDYSAKDIQALAPRPVWRAVHFDEATAEDALLDWDEQHERLPNLAAILVDTPDPDQAGGTGRSFDWNALRAVLDRVRPRVPVVLAGGLTPQNVGRATQTVQPWAVDVSSGVEAQRGVKDLALIRQFCEAVNRPV
ncbi:MAG: phosphoribosylanthranilate isomerase [Planctomycetota bacterium]|jgi:phosphoribosylanthranilate isomerase